MAGGDLRPNYGLTVKGCNRRPVARFISRELDSTSETIVLVEHIRIPRHYRGFISDRLFYRGLVHLDGLIHILE